MLALLLPISALAGSMPPIQTVFIILMESIPWSSIKNSSSAPYMNNVLLPQASYCSQYFNDHNNSAFNSLPTYLWLESGTDFGITDDNPPSMDHQSTTNHLVTQLKNRGITWKTYQEDITGTVVPLADSGSYAVRHNPFVYFDDVTGTNKANYAYGIAHIRPYTELSTDLASNTVARYNFITPNLCHDMHNSCTPLLDQVRQGDTWLSTEIPKIMASTAFTNNGVIFITWDDASANNTPIGLIAVSPLAKGNGYVSTTHYSHSMLLRTFQEIFGVTPLLGDAVNMTDLSDLFSGVGLGSVVRMTNGGMQLTAVGEISGRTYLVQASSNLVNWVSISTNMAGTNAFTSTYSTRTNSNRCFYRLVQLP